MTKGFVKVVALLLLQGVVVSVLTHFLGFSPAARLLVSMGAGGVFGVMIAHYGLDHGWFD